jgi:large subunit ribosomal protein L23
MTKSLDPFNVIMYPLSTEKTIRLMESENKLAFIVSKKAKKEEVKKAVETLFKAKVKRVNLFVDKTGKKKAFVKFSNETPAIDVATQLGLM